MYGFVSNVTGDIYVGYDTEVEATEMATSMGLTRVTIRKVVERPARRPGRTEDQRCADSMSRFLAGGQ